MFKRKTQILVLVGSIAIGILFFCNNNIQKITTDPENEDKRCVESVFNLSESYSATISTATPIVLRNAIDLSKINNNTKSSKYSNCQFDLTDLCVNMLKEKMIEYFGDEILEAMSPETTSGVPNTTHSVYISLKDYLTNVNYSQYTVHSAVQLGTYSEYESFLSNNITDFIQQQSKYDWIFLGNQFFMSRGIQTGSPMHFAGGINVFLMLAGRKRWMLIPPKLHHIFNCTMGSDGIYGLCRKHISPFGYINIDDDIYPTLQKYNISKQDIDKYNITDVILNPGDILINPPRWAHTIENLSPETVAHSLRFIYFGYRNNDPIAKWMFTFGFKFVKSHFNVILRRFDWLYKMLTNNRDKLTRWDYFWAVLIKKSDILNYDKRLKSRSNSQL